MEVQKTFVWKSQPKSWQEANPALSPMYKVYSDGTEEFLEKGKTSKIKAAPHKKPVTVKEIISEIGKVRKKRDHTGTCGIYIVICEATKSVYVGQSVNIESRLRSHKGQVTNLKCNYKLYTKIREDFKQHGNGSIEYKLHKSVNELTQLTEEEIQTMREFIEKGYSLYNTHVPLGRDSVYCPPQFKDSIKTIISALCSNRVSETELLSVCKSQSASILV